MKKLGILFILLLLICALPVVAMAAESLVPVGQVVGLQLGDNSVVIAGFDNSIGSACQQAGLRVGDKITHIGTTRISCPQDVQKALSGATGQVEVQFLRSGKNQKTKVLPIQTDEGPKLGIYLKQGITGIGTITWYNPENGVYGALGHGVNFPRGQLCPIKSGNIYRASVVSVVKGKVGDPGQLLGSLQGKDPVGKIYKNTEQGIFGTSEIPFGDTALPVAQSREVKIGDAKILCNISGTTVQEYSVEILKIYPISRGGGRNMLIKVTDPALLSATGGIVQGMSGSPIIQDGKLVGAVTHVLVNDPTTGYGIFIENMLDAAA